jgi:methanogenic corrinoid protein MtbC1
VLAQPIASEIIARLLLLHRVSDLGAMPSIAPIGRGERRRFLSLVLRGETPAANALLDELVARGIEERELLLDLISDTAARLGELWEEDEADFGEVTMAACVLHRLLRDRSASAEKRRGATDSGAAVLVATLTGEQHTLGATIVSELFRQAGWKVNNLAGGETKAVCECLSAHHFNVLALSSAGISDEAAAADQVRRFREASCSPDLKILAGGYAFDADPNLFKRIGADLMSDNIDDVLTWQAGCT